MSAASFGYAISLLPVGWLTDRIGAKWPIVIGDFIAGICMILLYFATSFLWLLSFMFFTGLGCGFLLPSTTQGIVVWFPPRERATVMGLKQTAVNVGGITTAVTLPAIALALGWRACFLILGVIPLVIALLATLLYKEPPPEQSLSPHSSSSADLVPLKAILKSPEIWLVSGCGFCMTWVEMTIVGHLVLYLTEELLLGVVAAGALLAATQAAGGVARPGGGLLSDRFFNGRRKPVFMLMALTASIFSLILGVLGSKLSWLLYPALIFMGTGGVGFGAIYLTLLSEFGGRHGAGKAVGLGGTIGLLGAAIGPTVFGYIVDVSGSYMWAWLSLAAISGLCAVTLLFVREKYRRI